MPSSSRHAPAARKVGLPAFLVGLGRWLRGEIGFALRLLVSWALWPIVLAILALAVLAYQRPGSYVVDVGSRSDQAYTRNFHTRLEDMGRTYRWSDVYGYVAFPGVGGSRPFTITTTIDTQRPAPIEIHINGERFFQGEVDPGWQTFSFKVDESHPSVLASRDSIVEFRAPGLKLPGEEGEIKGLKIDNVVLEQAMTGGFIWPSVSTLVYLALAILLVYVLTGRVLHQASRPTDLRVRALVMSALAGLGLCWVLFADRTAASVVMPHVVVTLGSMLVLLIAGEGVVRRIVVGRNKHGPRLVALCLAVAFGLRYGGMALPQSVIIDMPYHMKWLRTLLNGDWQSLYFPGGLSTVPPEWGMSLLIPKSPLFYFAVAPLGAIPLDLETLTKWLICLLDASIVLFAYWFTRRVGASSGAALAAAFLYAFMPLAFRALSYGILPTIFAQWLAVVLLAFVLVCVERGWRVGYLLVAFLLATLTLLAFPTVALFVSLIVLIAPLLWLLVRSSAEKRRRFSWQPYLVLVVAWLVSIVAYYGLYVEPVIASAQALLAPSAGGGTTVKWPGGAGQLIAWTADYLASLLPVLLAATGIILLFAQRRLEGSAQRALLLLAVWLAIAPLFVVVNYKVDMIGKHLFFIMLPVAVAGGVALRGVWARGAWGARLGVLVAGTVAWQAAVFWVERLVRAST